MNHRLTVTSALAVVLASLSLFAVLNGGGWLVAGAGAAITVALAGTLTRLDSVRAAIAATVLALLASFPLLAAQSWHWKLAGIAIIAATAASVTRLKALPVLAGAVTYLAGLLVYLNAAFASGQALARIVPTSSSLHHLWQVADQGFAMRAYAPPVPSTRGVEVLAAAGIGLVAIATDLLAVRLRSPAIAGLPLLVLFSVPVTTSAKPAGLGSTVTFCLAVAGFLALLAADGRERLRIWGRLVTVWYGAEPDEQAKGPDTRALAAAGRRVGVAAVSVALVVPLLIPSLRLHRLFAKHDLPGTGVGVGLPAALDQMRQQLTGATAGQQTVLTYTTSDLVPSEEYLPLSVLNYDSQTQDFSIVHTGPSTLVGRGALPAVPGMAASTPVAVFRTQITMSKSVTGYGSSLNFLPVPYAPASIGVPGSWQEDDATLMVYSGSAKLAGLSYRVTSTKPEPAVAELNISQSSLPASVDQYLSYGGPEEARLQSIARSVTGQAQTAYEKASALADWFSSTGGFSYSLHPRWLATSGNSLSSQQQLVNFLTVDKVGYCQQFAYGMAVLARLLGIPSRIAVGYTAGTYAGNHVWKVTEADAHAWPELYFKGVGWVRFEPTPGGSTGQRTATQPDYGGLSGPRQGGPNGQAGLKITSPGGGKANRNNSARKFVHLGANGAATPLAKGGGAPILPVLLILLGLAAVAPGTVRLLVRRGRWRRAAGDARLAHAAWRELRDELHDFGLDCRASESPRAIARRVGMAEDLEPADREALDRIARAEERASYAVRPEAAGTLRKDVMDVRRALSRRASPATRWRARLLPPSTLAPVRAGLQHSLDIFGWLDAAGRRVRRRLAREPLSQTGA